MRILDCWGCTLTHTKRSSTHLRASDQPVAETFLPVQPTIFTRDRRLCLRTSISSKQSDEDPRLRFTIKLVVNLATAVLLRLKGPYWKANSFSASQIPWFTRNPKIHYTDHNRIHFVSEPDSVNVLKFYLFKSAFIISLLSTSWSTEWSLSFGFPHQNLVYFSKRNAANILIQPALLRLKIMGLNFLLHRISKET